MLQSLIESARETLSQIGKWNRLIEQNSDLIVLARSADDIRRAKMTIRLLLRLRSNTAPIEEDIDLVEIMTCGVRFMQLSYNNQSLCATEGVMKVRTLE